jgi:hypothetical protein
MLNQNFYITDFVRYVTSDKSAARGNGEAVPMKEIANGGDCDQGSVECGQ